MRSVSIAILCVASLGFALLVLPLTATADVEIRVVFSGTATGTMIYDEVGDVEPVTFLFGHDADSWDETDPGPVLTTWDAEGAVESLSVAVRRDGCLFSIAGRDYAASVPDPASDACNAAPEFGEAAVFTLNLDTDQDGVLDQHDNCLVLPNGPLASTAECDAQEDADLDGYGNPCDTDYNNNGATDLVDIFNALLAAAALSTDYVFDNNCNGAADLSDVQHALTELNIPGPSGKACAGTIPCP